MEYSVFVSVSKFWQGFWRARASGPSHGPGPTCGTRGSQKGPSDAGPNPERPEETSGSGPEVHTASNFSFCYFRVFGRGVTFAKKPKPKTKAKTKTLLFARRQATTITCLRGVVCTWTSNNNNKHEQVLLQAARNRGESNRL